VNACADHQEELFFKALEKSCGYVHDDPEAHEELPDEYGEL